MTTVSESVIPLVQLRGTFLVESYQRGYRWTKEQVTDLLEDFTAFARQDGLTVNDVYFLQPIVVSRLESPEDHPRWELIDGQQRLTTIYLMNAVLRNLLHTKSRLSFDIEYSSRPGSAAFLKRLAENPGLAELPEAEDNMDFYHMFQACRTIYTCFSQKAEQQCSLLYQRFTENIRVLWYDTTTEDSSPVERFSRLNMGRIPLTGAELSRALLLNSANHDLTDELPAHDPRNKLADYYREQQAQQIMTRRQTVLGSRWDDIERELHDPDFWAFLGGSVSDTPATRIGFLLDLYTNKPASEMKEYFAFDALSQLLDPASANDRTARRDAQKLWDDITRSYQMLRFWYENHDYYHWIGYLNNYRIRNQNNRKDGEEIRILLQHAKEMRKSDFTDFVFARIRRTVSDTEELPTLKKLEYEKNEDQIHKLLFLFNVEYTRKNGRSARCRQTGRFPFGEHREHSWTRFPFGEHREHSWTLEHIQARNVESLRKYEHWRAWVEDHQRALREMRIESLPREQDDDFSPDEAARQKEELVSKCQKFLDQPQDKAGDAFVRLSDEILDFMRKLNSEGEIHSLFNLALLDGRQNIVLSNSIFAVKCHLVREMRKRGEYVPLATEALFMRRFSTEDLHLPYWSETDRTGYEEALREVLSTFAWKTTKEGAA